MRIRSRVSAILALASAVSVVSLRAELKLPSVLGDNMVLQQQQAVPIWGWSDPGAKVTVTFAGQTKSAKADGEGRWMVRLGKLKASAEPRTLVVEAGERRVLTNILVGEVWLASGQSNMEKPIGVQAGQKPCFNAEQELGAANYPQIRIFKVEKGTQADAPMKEFKRFHGWQECSSNSLNGISFSAAAYFFGREIHTNLQVPVGLIESSWGGTRIEPWVAPPKAAVAPWFAEQLRLESANAMTNSKAALSRLYNAMIAPLAGFAMRGALWYQGESNCLGKNDGSYADKMAALIAGWRQVWGEGDFPFYFVQIAPFKYYGGKTQRAPSPETLPEFWTVQSRAARQIPNTGMVVTTDLVDDLNDIHPRNKQVVGHRLALLALSRTYGQKQLVCAGPAFKRMKVVGNKAILAFDNVDGGLISQDGQPLTWFTAAGADGNFVPASARVVGKTVEVTAAGVERPTAVRFAWQETAQPNLFNLAGLPAEPFRTDAR